MQIQRIRHAIGDAGRAAGKPHAFPRTPASAPNNWYSLYITPTYTPTWPARSCSDGTCRLARVYPASSIAIHACCRNRRSCGSMYLRFFRRYVEEQRIEFIDASDEAAPFAVMAPALTPIFAEVGLPVPALSGNFDDAIFPVAQILPVGVDIDGFGIAAAQPDDGDRIGFRLRAEPASRGRPKRRLDIGAVRVGAQGSRTASPVRTSDCRWSPETMPPAAPDEANEVTGSTREWSGIRRTSVLDSGPNVFSSWLVSFIARIESIPYFSRAACGSILLEPAASTVPTTVLRK